MLHILWVILKILLMILAVVMGLILLLLLLILFVPIRYRGKGESKEKQLHGQARVSWLLHLLSATVEYENGKLDYTIRILGISLEAYQAFGRRIKSLFGRRKKNQKVIEPLSEPVADPSERIENTSDPAVGLLESEEQVETWDLTTVQEPNEDAEKEKIQGEEISFWKRLWLGIQRIAGTVARWFGKIRSIPKKIIQFLGKIRKMFCNFGKKIKDVGNRLNKWKQFLEDDRTKAGLKRGFGEGKILLKHVAPRRIRGNVRFGFDNPATTGQVLALIGTTCPIHKNVVDVVPVFDEKIFRGNLDIRGRIYLFMLVKSAIRLYFDKNIKYIWKAVQKEG